LRFDPDGEPDKLPELLAIARERKLNDDEIQLLAEALRSEEPWLEWAGKREKRELKVDPVALHIHERVSTQAILKVAARQDAQRDLFADPQQSYHEAVQFYQHDIDWANRMILGDSLQVMASLAQREDLAGKVQMIYLDPPYGIKFASNFQPEIGKRDVKDKEQDLTREAEMVKAYRDTWQLGVHSYLSYLRDRLVVAKELLADSGSIFVQISDENLHRVRNLLDEIFGSENFCSVVGFRTTTGKAGALLDSTFDFLLWYAKDNQQIKFRPIYLPRIPEDDENLRWIESAEGTRKRVLEVDKLLKAAAEGGRVFRPNPLTSQSGSETTQFEYEFQAGAFSPAKGGWKTNLRGMQRLDKSDRLTAQGNTLCFVRYLDDFPCKPSNNIWDDTRTSGYSDPKRYVVQTNQRVIERCLLMTTDPGDLVLDPTCGSGTTAYVAEQWGRRWITCDTSRVAIAIARQRLLTAKFDYYQFKDEAKGVAGGFNYKTVPHITLKSIAQNTNLDPIFAKHEPALEEKLAACNAALSNVSDELRARLQRKLLDKQKSEGRKAITDADRRRWELPKVAAFVVPPSGGQSSGKRKQPPEGGTTNAATNASGWRHWQVPFDTDSDWPRTLIDAVTAYRRAWRAKMDEVNDCIAANADQEELVDQPQVVKGVTRVSGPFTVEAVQPPEMSLGDEQVFGFEGEPEEMETFGDAAVSVRMVETRAELEAQNLDAYLDQMLRLLKTDGVRFPNNKQMKFSRLEPLFGNAGFLHAEGRWVQGAETDGDADGRAAVSVTFGPQYGPVTAMQVEEATRSARINGYEDLVVAGFSFDGAAQTIIEQGRIRNLRVHLAHIRPDVNPGMNGLLKEQPGSQLFTVFGSPRTRLEGPNAEGEYTVVMEGVDIYNPVDNSITPTGAGKVAAWFVDSDYDGRTFCITQAFFPDRGAWEKLSKALGGVVDAERFEALSGTISLPVPAGKHKRIAVKVIDPRGNEVMTIHQLG
jgi:adenine-specific DNA-methyltransferase